MLEVRVNPDDIGKVIGRSGRTATALRTVVGALAGRRSVRVDFVDVDRPAGRRQSGAGGALARPWVSRDGRDDRRGRRRRRRPAARRTGRGRRGAAHGRARAPVRTGAQLRGRGSSRPWEVESALALAAGCSSASPGWPTAPPSRRCAASAWSTSTATSGPSEPRSTTTASWSGCGARRRRYAVGRVAMSCICPIRTCSRSAPSTAAGWCRSSRALVPEVDLANGMVTGGRDGLLAESAEG